MDKRLFKINNLLREYSKGNFDKNLKASARMDEIDACITSINMLDEELKDATISRNYFNNIFNSVTDMVFVINKTGVIKDINIAVTEQLLYQRQEIVEHFLDDFFDGQEQSLFKIIIKYLRNKGDISTKISNFKAVDGHSVPVRFNASWLSNDQKEIVLLAQDITTQVHAETVRLRAIIDAEENERQRLARDLHDGLGQQLSAIKFFVSACTESAENEDQKLKLKKCNEELIDILADMRSICFNLIPKTLKEFGLVKAIKELCNQIARNNKIDFSFKCDELGANIPVALSIDIFRIIQEFINNAQRHGKANKIKIRLSHSNHEFVGKLKDNGVGFYVDEKIVQGIGLHNVRSRVKSHKGEIKISSTLGKGTAYYFSIPLK